MGVHKALVLPPSDGQESSLGVVVLKSSLPRGLSSCGSCAQPRASSREPVSGCQRLWKTRASQASSGQSGHLPGALTLPCLLVSNHLFFQTPPVAGGAFASHWSSRPAGRRAPRASVQCRAKALSDHASTFSDLECWPSRVTAAKLEPLSPASHPREPPSDYGKTEKHGFDLIQKRANASAVPSVITSGWA